MAGKWLTIRLKRWQKRQVCTGAPPGTRTPNPRIKSPLLCSLILLELLSNNASTCQELPLCPIARIRAALRIPSSAGAYRGVRANMEQTSMCTGLDHRGRGRLTRIHE